MIVDVTGIVLTPGNNGRDCWGNGTHFDADGTPVECCCDECDYWLCCYEQCCCDECEEERCPRMAHA